MDTTEYKNQRQNIVSPIDIKIYDEILSACEHNLFRAAYILSWIGIVESLKNKIYALADIGDSRAENMRSNILDQEKNKNSTDRTIFEGAISCEIVPARYGSDLEYLWQQRCLYGHPYQYTPDEKDVKWIIDEALEITLSQSLMYNRKRVNDFITEELNSFHIVPQDIQHRDAYILGHLNMIQEKHYALLFKNLCYHIENLRSQNNNSKKISYLLRFVRTFAKEKKPDINDKAYRVSDGIANWPITMWYIAAIPEVWALLDDAHKLSLFQYFDSSTGTILHTCTTAIHHLITNGVVLEQQQIDTFYKKLNQQTIAESWQRYLDKDILLSRIEKEWVIGQSWGKQAAYLDWLTNLTNQIANFNDDQLMFLGVLIGYCCRYNAIVVMNYVKARTGEWFSNSAFRVGVAKGLLSYNDKFSFANNCIGLTMNYLSSLPDNLQNDVRQQLLPFQFEPTNIRIDIQDQLKELVIEKDALLNNDMKAFLNERINGCFIKKYYGFEEQ